MKKAIFLDRDGVLIKEMHYLYKKKDVEIIEKVIEALKIFKDKGYLLIVVTNQPVIARGLINEEDIIKLHEYLNERLNFLIDSFYICPHHPEMHEDVPDNFRKYRIKCNCRKPSPGMILKAAKKYNIDLSKSYMIGDMVSDIVAGKEAGCKTIMVESPKNKEIIKSSKKFDLNEVPDFKVKDLFNASLLLQSNNL